MLAMTAKVLMNPGRRSQLHHYMRFCFNRTTGVAGNDGGRPGGDGGRPGAADSRCRAARFLSMIRTRVFIIPFIGSAERAF